VAAGALLAALIALSVVVDAPFGTAIDGWMPPGEPRMAAALAALVSVAAAPLVSALAGAVAALLLFLFGRRQSAVLVLLTVGAAGAVGMGMKLLVSRERPMGAEVVAADLTASFPSGHVTMATAMALSLAFALTSPGTRVRLWGALGAFTVAALVGLGRVAGGAHFVTDVIGGLLLGTAAAFIAEWILGARWRVAPATVRQALRGNEGRHPRRVDGGAAGNPP